MKSGKRKTIEKYKNIVYTGIVGKEFF